MLIDVVQTEAIQTAVTTLLWTMPNSVSIQIVPEFSRHMVSAGLAQQCPWHHMLPSMLLLSHQHWMNMAMWSSKDSADISLSLEQAQCHPLIAFQQMAKHRQRVPVMMNKSSMKEDKKLRIVRGWGIMIWQNRPWHLSVKRCWTSVCQTQTQRMCKWVIQNVVCYVYR